LGDLCKELNTSLIKESRRALLPVCNSHRIRVRKEGISSCGYAASINAFSGFEMPSTGNFAVAFSVLNFAALSLGTHMIERGRHLLRISEPRCPGKASALLFLLWVLPFFLMTSIDRVRLCRQGVISNSCSFGSGQLIIAAASP
jgi:hypothetical protein